MEISKSFTVVVRFATKFKEPSDADVLLVEEAAMGTVNATRATLDILERLPGPRDVILQKALDRGSLRSYITVVGEPCLAPNVGQER